jgi:photosystem II PsbT protein
MRGTSLFTWIDNFRDVAERFDMESVAYILILTLAIGVLFFAIAFREPPRIGK